MRNRDKTGARINFRPMIAQVAPGNHRESAMTVQ